MRPPFGYAIVGEMISLPCKGDFLSRPKLPPVSMSLSPDAPLEVLRDYVTPAALSNYIGKLVTIGGIFLTCYEWGMFVAVSSRTLYTDAIP